MCRVLKPFSTHFTFSHFSGRPSEKLTIIFGFIIKIIFKDGIFTAGLASPSMDVAFIICLRKACVGEGENFIHYEMCVESLTISVSSFYVRFLLFAFICT